MDHTPQAWRVVCVRFPEDVCVGWRQVQYYFAWMWSDKLTVVSVQLNAVDLPVPLRGSRTSHRIQIEYRRRLRLYAYMLAAMPPHLSGFVKLFAEICGAFRQIENFSGPEVFTFSVGDYCLPAVHCHVRRGPNHTLDSTRFVDSLGSCEYLFCSLVLANSLFIEQRSPLPVSTFPAQFKMSGMYQGVALRPRQQECVCLLDRRKSCTFNVPPHIKWRNKI